MHKEEQIKYALNQVTEQGNLAAIDQIFSSNYIAHAEGKAYKGHPFLKKFTKQIRLAIPDIKTKKVVFLMEAGDTITWERTLQGTHKTNMMGIPASNKKITWQEMVVSRFEDGKIVEEWLVSNLAGQLLLKQKRKK